MAIRLSVELEGSLYEILVDDQLSEKTRKFKLSLKNETHCAYKDVELLAHIRNRIVLSIENRVYDLIVDPGQNEVSVNWKNRFNKIRISEGIAKPGRTSGSSQSGSGIAKAQMPGKVVSVLKKVGDIVSQGDGVLVIEAMKMQNEIKAEKDGHLTACPVRENDNVNTGDTLFEIN